MEPGGVGRDSMSGCPTAVQAPGHVYDERERRGGEGGRERREGKERREGRERRERKEGREGRREEKEREVGGSRTRKGGGWSGSGRRRRE